MARNDEARIARIIDIVSTFTPYTTLSLQELSTETGATADDLRRDLLMLRELDIGFGYIDIEIEGDSVRCGQLPSAFSEPLLLDDMQMLAFALALHMTGLTADTQLLDKLYQSASGAWSREFIEKHIYIYPLAHSNEVFKALAIGLRNSYPVEITYIRNRKETVRLIDVARMSLESRGWYVSGYCRMAKEPRVFKLESIKDAKIIYLDRALAANNLNSAESAREALSSASEDAEVATIVFDSRSSFVEQDWPLATEAQVGEDGSVTIQVPVVNTTWLARTIVGLCGRARVVSPPRLVGGVRDFALQYLSELPQ